jgi:hypothetical protein
MGATTFQEDPAIATRVWVCHPLHVRRWVTHQYTSPPDDLVNQVANVPRPDCSVGMNVIRRLSRVIRDRVGLSTGAEHDARALGRHAACGLADGAAAILLTMPILASTPDIAFFTVLAPTRSLRTAVRHTAKTKRPT